MSHFSAASQYVFGAAQIDSTYLFAIENRHDSGVNVTLKRAVFQRDPGSVAYTGIMPIQTAYRAYGLTHGGNVSLLDKCPFDTNLGSSDGVMVWAGANSLSIPTPMGGTPISAAGHRAYGTRMRDLTGQVLSNDGDLSPSGDAVIDPGHMFIWAVDVDSATADPLTAAWFFQCAWEETAISTYTISGTVKDGGVGVVGAKVTVLIADDTSLTNAVLLHTVTTTSGGAWSANIPVGKVAYAYAQNFEGGTYYTAPGAPYIV